MPNGTLRCDNFLIFIEIINSASPKKSKRALEMKLFVDVSVNDIFKDGKIVYSARRYGSGKKYSTIQPVESLPQHRIPR